MLTKATKLTNTGVDFEQFAVGLNLASFPEAIQFVAREKELSKMHEVLQDYSSRSCVILHGLGGMGKDSASDHICQTTQGEIYGDLLAKRE